MVEVVVITYTDSVKEVTDLEIESEKDEGGVPADEDCVCRPYADLLLL